MSSQVDSRPLVPALDAAPAPRYGLLAAAAAIVLSGGLLYLAFVARHGVNVLFWDEWTLVGYFRQFEAGRATLGGLLTVRHSDHLVGVPLILMLFQHLITGMSSKAMQMVGALFQCLAVVLLVIATRKEWLSWRFPLIAVLAIVLLVLSIGQYRNILWGFQPPWFLVSLLLVACLMILDHQRTMQSRYAFGLAVACAVAASFTSMHGLLVWAAGLVVLLARRNGSFLNRIGERDAILWTVFAVLTLVVYAGLFLQGRQGLSPHLNPANLFSSPLFAIKFVLMHFGSIAGDVRSSLAIVCGTAVLAFLAAALYRAHLFGWDRRTGLPLGLVALPLGFALLVLVGRSSFGLSSAVDLRYTAYVPFLLVGTLLLLFRPRPSDAPAWSVVRWGFAVFLFVILPSALYTGLVGAKQWRLEQGLAAIAVRDFESAPAVRLERLVYRDVRLVKEQAAYMKANRLNVFSIEPTDLPDEITPYLDPPPAYAALMAASPAEAKALRQLWDTFVVGNDLRAAFDVYSPEFPRRLVQWAYGATKNGDHYLNEYLKDHRAAYESVWQRLEAR